MDTSNKEKEWFHRLKKQVGEATPTDPTGTEKPKATGRDKDTFNKDKEKINKKPKITSPKKGNGFKDIAGMNKLKELVTEGFINILKHKECAARYGIKPPAILFYGPSGCGKSYFAEKMAEELGIHFIKVEPDDLACTWIHGTQAKIGEVFREAEQHAPTLLFFDEFDAMVPKRFGTETTQAYDSEVNEFLCMLNNAADRGIYVLAATNHPERIDKAVLRTGRIDELIYIDMPDKEARTSLFDLALSRLPIDETVNTERLAELTQGYNCSDICYIVKSAARKMFNETIKAKGGDLKQIGQTLLEESIANQSPSVNPKDLLEYERIRSELSPKEKCRKQVTIGFR